MSKTTVVIACTDDGYWNGTTDPKCSNLPIFVSSHVSTSVIDFGLCWGNVGLCWGDVG